MKFFLLIFVAFISLSLEAKKVYLDSGQNINSVISFSAWKAEQVVLTKNSLVRMKNWLFLKKGYYQRIKDLKSEQDENFPDQLSEERTLEMISVAEKRVKQIERNLQIANELSFSDYLAVYVSQFSENKKKLSLLVDKMNKEEVLKLLIYAQSQSLVDSNKNKIRKKTMSQTILNPDDAFEPSVKTLSSD